MSATNLSLYPEQVGNYQQPAVRLRKELLSSFDNILSMDSERCTCSITNPDDSAAPPKSFTFDSVYDVASTTEQIYNDIVYPLIEGVLEGYNSTVFAYGQTGCGKSYTMQGSLVPPSSRGIIPRAFEHIFEAISLVENKKFLVVASYLEIYNEDIRDLLAEDCKMKLELKENPQTGVCVPELSRHTVQNVEECEKLMEIGWRNRSTGSTLMNADSSRSHSIFTIALEMMSNCNVAAIRRGKLNLVDLAGSERQAKTGATGERLKEATKINLSLMALGNVISALVDGKSKHIPYRDSKLTRLLQDSLGGNTKTLMIACLSPASNNYDESLSTLRYANRAKNIRNKPRINEDPKDAMLREYQQEIEKLKTMLKEGTGAEILKGKEMYVKSNESEKLRNNYENEMLRLKEEYEREQKTKQKLQQDMDDLKKHYENQLTNLQRQNEMKLNNASHQQVLERLRRLQASMIGGERAGDKELKEKRLKKKKAAEKRLEALASVLSKVNDEDGVMLRVYDDIREELKAKTETLRKYKQKIRGMESEISDLLGEFENERTDYLETIRRSERQLQLYQQITDKMAAALKKECNYCNLEQIRQEAVWSDELERWKLPELTIARTKFPPTVQNGNNANWMTLAEKYQKMNSSEDNTGNWNNLSERLSSGSSNDSSSVFQRTDRREPEDLAGSYFKPRRANELLSKAREDASKAFSTWKEFTNKHKIRHLGSGQQSPRVHGSLTSLNLSGSEKSSSAGDAEVKHSLNNSWNGDWEVNGTWGDPTRRPFRLEALPLLRTKENSTFKKSDVNILELN